MKVFIALFAAVALANSVSAETAGDLWMHNDYDDFIKASAFTLHLTNNVGRDNLLTERVLEDFTNEQYNLNPDFDEEIKQYIEQLGAIDGKLSKPTDRSLDAQVEKLIAESQGDNQFEKCLKELGSFEHEHEFDFVTVLHHPDIENAKNAEAPREKRSIRDAAYSFYRANAALCLLKVAEKALCKENTPASQSSWKHEGRDFILKTLIPSFVSGKHAKVQLKDTLANYVRDSEFARGAFLEGILPANYKKQEENLNEAEKKILTSVSDCYSGAIANLAEQFIPVHPTCKIAHNLADAVKDLTDYATAARAHAIFNACRVDFEKNNIDNLEGDSFDDATKNEWLNYLVSKEL